MRTGRVLEVGGNRKKLDMTDSSFIFIFFLIQFTHKKDVQT